MDGLCFDDLDEFGRELDDPYAELEQDVVHVLFEAFGSNPDVLSRGVGLTGALSAPANRLPQIRAQVESQLSDDPRITGASCSITLHDPAAGAYRVDLELVVNGETLAFSFIADSAGGVRRAA